MAMPKVPDIPLQAPPLHHTIVRDAVRLRRPLDPLYAERWQSTEVGKRGGLEVRPPFKRHVAVTPEEFHADYNAWYELYGDVATTERFKPAASLAKNAEILRKVCLQLSCSCELADPRLQLTCL